MDHNKQLVLIESQTLCIVGGTTQLNTFTVIDGEDIDKPEYTHYRTYVSIPTKRIRYCYCINNEIAINIMLNYLSE